ncbi:hypothetical protein NET03_01455 [Thermomicrobium sp. CFH 73360]|uniref:hypothetical protein n=1 Tax=Thermomicrobium sp. CFH 73360 TaxID=2951987 RepID=UPI0020769179|nr:hypothetical protein [Thermomicrobium sp. CFH 73360]MCM8745190.1 hypothetical protein [Thermomicrobium sp. CFH 73360]
MGWFRSLGWLLIGLIGGLLFGSFASSYQPNGHIVVGGTGRTLSVVLLLGDSEIIVGGGTVPNDVVELADRSTVPWQRPYELLIIPSWDTEHVPGALSLIERGTLRSVAIVGPVKSDPVWTILERQAELHHATVRFITAPSRLLFDQNTTLELLPSEAGLVTCLRSGSLVVEVRDQRVSAQLPANCGQSAAVVSLRQASSVDASLLIRPRPRRAQELVNSARYEIQLDRGERVTLRLGTSELRVRRDKVVTVPTAAPGGTQGQ